MVERLQATGARRRMGCALSLPRQDSGAPCLGMSCTTFHARPKFSIAQMALTKERKAVLIGEHQRAKSDSGSPEVQIAILTTRVGDLTQHLRTHTKDYASRRGLLMMVSRRRRLLDYLKTVDPQRYLDVIRRLDIRK